MSEDKPYWIRDSVHQLSRKTYGRIWVRTESDRERVLKLIREIDEDEFESYMPKDFVAVMPEDPNEAKLSYGHKFEIRTDWLQYECWKAGIEIWIVTGYREPTFA